MLTATILGSSLAFIDATAINVALPVLQSKLRASVADAQWIVEAYALFLSSFVLVGGALADRIGRRRTFSLGILVFAAASLACGLAPGVGTLIAARAVQGMGAALLVPSSLAMIGAGVPKEDRGRAVGTWSSLTAIAGVVGPFLGGWLAQAVSWRAVFYINLPVAAAALVVAARKVPETRNPSVGRPDFAGAFLATAGLGALVYGLIEAPELGWRDARVLASVSGGVAALAAFFAVERRRRDPMLSMDLFRIRSFAGANLLTFFLYAALSAALFFLPFDLIQARGFSPAAAGAALLPLVLAIFLLSRWAGAMSDRLGSRLPLTAGPFVASVGFLMLALAGRSGPYVRVLLPPLAVLGLGTGITVAPLTTTVLDAVGPDAEGSASGINNAVARVASLLAIAVFGILATAEFARDLDRRLASSDVSAATRTALRGQISKLGALEPPADARPAEAETIRRSVAASLGASFRAVGMLCAALALIAAFFGFWGAPSGGLLRGARSLPR